MAAYWITVQRNRTERLGFSAETAEQTLAAVEQMRREGWNEVRIIDPDGVEVTAYSLQVALDSVKAETI